MSICVKYRQSKSGDTEEISKLFKSCFCDFNAYDKSYDNPLYELDGRYIVATVDNKIVGMSGVCYDKEKDTYSLDYTCVDPEYRNNGITEQLFSILIPMHEDKEIWFEVWRATWEDRAESLFKKFGFKQCKKAFKTYVKRFDKCSNCRFDKGVDCICESDLYVHEAYDN